MNPAKRKKLHRLSLAATKTEVKQEEVKVEVAPVAAEVVVEPVATVPQEAQPVEAPKPAQQVSKKTKKVVETEE